MATVPISNAVRWVVTLAAFVYANWSTLSSLFGRAVELGATEPILGYYSTFIFEYRDTPAGAWGIDRGQFGLHWVNVTGGDPDFTWTAADFAAAETLLTNFWSGHTAYFPNTIRAVEIRWYAFGPGVAAPNPTVRVTPIVAQTPGASGGSGPRQLACAMTLKTPLRKHWGRFYLPITGSATCDASGRLPSATVDGLAVGLNTLALGDTGQGVFPCVYDRVRHGVFGISAVQVDDIPDVIRRRRPSTTLYRKQTTLAA